MDGQQWQQQHPSLGQQHSYSLHSPHSPAPHTPLPHTPLQEWNSMQQQQLQQQQAAAAAAAASSYPPPIAAAASSASSSSSAAVPSHPRSTHHRDGAESYASKIRAEIAKFGDAAWSPHFVDYTQLRQIIKRIVFLEVNPQAQLSAEEAAVHQRALPAFSVSSTSSTASQQLRDIFWLMLGQELVKINTFFMRSEHELATRMHGELRLEHRLFEGEECRAKIAAEHQSYQPLVMQQLVARRAESGLHSAGLTVNSPEFLQFQQTLFPSTALSPQVSLMFLQALKELHPTLWSNIATNARALLPDLLSLIPYLPDATVLSLMRAFLQAILHMERLQKFGVINATIVLKLLKLYDFHTQRHAEKAYLSKLFAEPMFTSATIGQLIMQAQSCIHDKLLPLKLAVQSAHSPTVSRIQSILQEKLCPLCGNRAHFPVVLRCNHRACFSCLAKHTNFGSVCPVQGCNFHLKAGAGACAGITALARSQSKSAAEAPSGVGDLNPGDLQVESVLSKLMAISLATHEPEQKQKAASTAAAAAQPQQWVGQQASSSALPQSAPRKYRSSSVLVPGQYPPQSAAAVPAAAAVVQAQLVTPNFARGHSGNSDGSNITPTLATVVMAKPVSPSFGSSPKPAVAVATAAVVAGGGGAGASAGGLKASCHNCKTMREPRLLITCTVDGESGKRRRCRKRFCGACLMRMYSLDIHRMTAAERDSFQCPACLACCVCAACKKRDQAAGAPPVPMNPNTGLPLHSPYTHLQGSQITAAGVQQHAQQADASGFVSHHATPVQAARAVGSRGDEMQLIEGDGGAASSSVPPHQSAAASVADGSEHSRASSSVVLEFAPSLRPAAERRRVSLPEAAIRSQMETAEAALAAAAANAASNLLSPEALSPHSQLYQRRKSAGQIQNLEPPGAASMGVFFNGARTPGHLSPLSIVVGVQGASPLSPLTPNDGSPARSPRDGGKSPTLAATRRLLNRGILTVTPGGGSLPTLPSERGVRDHPYPKADNSPRISPRGLPRTLVPGKDGRVRSASVDGPVVNDTAGAGGPSRHPLQGTNASPARAWPAPGDLSDNGSAVVSATTSAATSSVSSAQPSPSLHAMQSPSFDLQMQTAQLQSQLASIASQLQSLQSQQAYDVHSNLPLSPGTQQAQLLATQQQLAMVSKQLFMLQHQQIQQQEQQQQQHAQQYYMQQSAAAGATVRPLDTTSRMGSLESIPPESGDFSDTISPHRVNGMLVAARGTGPLLMDSPPHHQQMQPLVPAVDAQGRALLDHPPSIDRAPSGDSAMASLSRMASLDDPGSSAHQNGGAEDPGQFFLRLNSQPHPHQIAMMSQFREQANSVQQGQGQGQAQGPPMLCGSDDSASPEMYGAAQFGSSADASPTRSRGSSSPPPTFPPTHGAKQPSGEFDVNSFLHEKDMNATVCLDMQGVNTIIKNPETKEPKTFAFDFSYWSHDGFHEGPDGELIPDTPKYATQQKVFNDLGNDVLTSAYDGYNSTLFAYGQTGAGKSFSMVGYGVNKGIIPMVCSDMFKTVDKAEAGKKYQVMTTMLEIYNECIRDLLNPAVNVPGGLKVRSKPGIGVYVENLTPVACSSYKEIEQRMDEGTTARTVASTKMNATSSRAHTVFGINFTTIQENDGAVSEMTARMNLVDLAGSERAESTGATGDRLKEGCAINASLSALGNVITALADIAMGKKKVFVPYRNSALTRLLQDALGGNSRTIMIAALSPADVNYDETLGTLRYADRCKKIKNAVVKMENPTDKIIRQLKEENSRLMALLSGAGIAVPVGGGGGGGGGGDGEGGDVEAMRAKLMEENEAKLKEQMAENEKIINEMKKSWEEKLKDSAAIVSSSSLGDSGAMHARNAMETKIPYIMNLHEDPQLSECVLYVFKKGVTRIGRKNPDVPQDVCLSGLNILAEHALVTNADGKVTIESLNKSKTFVNGDIVNKVTQLHTGDRVILGNNFVFRYTNPEEQDAREKKPDKDREWSDAIDEFSTKQGLRLQQSLGGEMGKLEQEETQKRKELEEKLAAMEEAMRRERETARKLMEEQKLTFSKRLESGEKLTEAEKAQMLNAESQLANKERNLEEEMVKRREISEKIIQEQMKRKRQTKKIEERLAKLIPLINEANSMAEELRKPVRFEARLSVKSNNVNLSTLDELRNLKTIDVTIRVTSLDNGNVWNWNHIKFDSRLFMMRELYQEYMDFGPRDIPKSKDPFWDPPEAVEIGKAYVYLKALSQLVEIESDFAIVDYKGDEQGQLSVSIFPEGPNGEDLDYLATSEELIGKPLTLLVRIPEAKGLPAKFNNDVFVNFAFMDQVKETEACEVKTTDPKWKFQTRFKYDNVTEELRQYLLKEAAVFEVRGFSDPQVHQAAAAEKESAASAPAAKLCAQCSEKPAESTCKDCALDFCEGCFKLLHKSAKKAGHTKVALNLAPAGVAAAAAKCAQCDEKPSVVRCVDCEKNFCGPCNDLLHKSAKRASHVRNPLASAPSLGTAFDSTAAPEIEKCQQCEEKPIQVSCVECVKSLCDGCNALLHKSAERQKHTRHQVGDQSGPGKCEQCDEGNTAVKCEECGKKLCDGCNTMLHRSAKRASHARTNL